MIPILQMQSVYLAALAHTFPHLHLPLAVRAMLRRDLAAVWWASEC